MDPVKIANLILENNVLRSRIRELEEHLSEDLGVVDDQNPRIPVTRGHPKLAEMLQWYVEAYTSIGDK